ncbi:MAG: protease [Clostridiaceae bacterium]|jgi:carboxyl-terminal processing protease|nr:protease [Clostridiaceae bacterium]
MKKCNKIVSGIISIIISAVFITGFNTTVFADSNTQSVLNSAKDIVKQYYIGDIQDSSINSAENVEGLVKSLNDPYSAYFTKQQYNDFVNSINNTFTGIGIQIDSAKEGIKILSVYDNTPAMKAGLKPGDIITKADGHSLSGMPVEQATSYVKGTPGTSVHLEVNRAGSLLSFDVLREKIVIPTVEKTVLNNHIGYLKISSFGDNTNTEFTNAYNALKKENVDSYIIDLRNNPGGYANISFDIAGYFIGTKLVSKMQPKTGDPILYYGTDHKEVIDKPTIFLINQYSASASEILSAAVKDNKKAVFVGENTYGKGVAQNVFMLPDSSYLKLTVLRFVSPLGNEINKKGISPDIKVKDDVNNGADSLNKAESLLSSLKPNETSSEFLNLALADKNNLSPNDNSKSEENAVKKLPSTGTVYDLRFYLIIGLLITISGICLAVLYKKQQKEKID